LRAIGSRGAVWLACLAAVLAASGALAGTASATPGVAAWGAGAEGELGTGSNGNASTFSGVSELHEVTSVAAGGNFSLALLGDGSVMSWGGNGDGQLGTGKAGESQLPVAIPGLEGVTEVSAGTQHALALLSDGTVEAWGEDVGATGSVTPKVVAGISDATAVAAGSEDKRVTGNGSVDLVLANGKVFAWGSGEDGQLGDGSTEDSATPVEVKNLSEVTAIAAGNGQSLALLANGTVMAWGENRAGDLGIGNTQNKDEPVQVQGLSEVVAISAGAEDSMALLASGTVETWGDNDDDQLGRSPSETISELPGPVSGLGEVTAISSGAVYQVGINTRHNLALLSDGSVMAWGGDKEGELGNGSEGGTSVTPVEVSGLAGATGIAAGASDGFAVGPPVPIVSSIETHTGHAGTKVEVKGFNLNGASAVHFGSVDATAIEADSATSLIAVAPAEKPQTVAVTVTTAFGTSGQSSEGRFRFVPEGNLEFGRCLSAGKHHGLYKKGCTELLSGGGYEWSKEIVETHFSLTGKSSELASAKGVLVTCKGAGGGSGEFVGPKSVGDVSLTFTGCAIGKGKHAQACASAGAAAGEIRSSQLEGAIGFTNTEKDAVALELLPVGGGAFLTFTCATTTTEVRGEALGAISPINSSKASFKVSFAGSNGKQHIEHFQEGLTAEVLEASAAGGPYEAADLSDEVTLTTKEPIEINSVV
jgi:alpha-tubulin suppressor-like RCC1 family protein